MKYKLPKGLRFSEALPDDIKFVDMSLVKAYLYPHTNIRILFWNGKECLIEDVKYKEERINVAVENKVITEIIGRG